MIFRYIEKDTIFHNLVPRVDIQLINGECYDIELRIDSPQIIVNGQAVEHPDATIWVRVNGVEIPYAPSLLDNFWRAVE